MRILAKRFIYKLNAPPCFGYEFDNSPYKEEHFNISTRLKEHKNFYPTKLHS